MSRMPRGRGARNGMHVERLGTVMPLVPLPSTMSLAEPTDRQRWDHCGSEREKPRNSQHVTLLPRLNPAGSPDWGRWLGSVQLGRWDDVPSPESAMTRLALAILLVLAFIGYGFAQNMPNVGKKSSTHSGCKLVGTVKGTKLWAGDCAGPDQLRSSAPQTDEPSLQDQARSAIPAGQT